MRHVRAGTELGRVAQDAMSRGDLIPDDLVIRMIADEVLGPDGAGGFVLDGFPRTVPAGHRGLRPGPPSVASRCTPWSFSRSPTTS